MSSRSPLPFVASFAVLAAVGVAPDVRAQEVGPGREELASGIRHRPFEKDEGSNPLRGSTLTLDQSMTTQTTQVQPSPELSYVPLYEIWVSLRPRYYFDEHWSVRARFDYTKELTNNQSTTFYREDVFGDIWTDLVYSTPIESLWPGTKVNAGVRAMWPISKASQANGTYLTLGALAGAVHTFDLRGEDAPSFEDMHVGLSFVYLHPFSNTTTPTEFGGFEQTVIGDENSITVNQIRGSTNINHNLWIIADTGLQITPKLSLTLDGILINQWHYPVPDEGIQVMSMTVNPPQTNAVTYTPNVWFIADVDYTLFDELDLSLGYYNLAGEIAPDGQRRGLFGSDNVFWSPDARVFFDITMNLDVLFDDAVHHKYSRQEAAADGTARRTRHLGGM